MTYKRTEAQRAGDFADSRAFEEAVDEAIPFRTITRFQATDDLDVWVPGYYVEVKEKKQRYTSRWTNLTHVPEQYLFICDELTIRRSLRHWPYVFFLIRDRTRGNTMYLVPVWEMVTTDRVRINRNGKGKWLVDLRSFRKLDSLVRLHEVITEALTDTPWKNSECLSALGVGEVQA